MSVSSEVLSDAELVVQWQGGDRKAGETLLHRYIQPLILFFRSRAQESALDLVQKTMLECIESVRRYRGEGSFRSYLFAIAYRTLCTHYTQQRRTAPAGEARTSQLEDPTPSASALIGARQQQRELLVALRRLPVDYQVALELHYWESMTIAEVAEVLGLPLGTTKSRVRRARELLDRELADLARGPALKSTLTSLEDWAQKLRHLSLSPQAPAPARTTRPPRRET